MAHPLSPLTEKEITDAVKILRKRFTGCTLHFRHVYLREPCKKTILRFDELPCSCVASALDQTREASCEFDVVNGDSVEYRKAVVDLKKLDIESMRGCPHDAQHPVAIFELEEFVEHLDRSTEYQNAIKILELPEHMQPIIEPWPYGGLPRDEPQKRFFQAFVFAQDQRNRNNDSNFYRWPLPLIPVMDWATKEVIRIDWSVPLDEWKAGVSFDQRADQDQVHEYVPELLSRGVRDGLRPIRIEQPKGVSFAMEEGSLNWQGWSFRVGFNPREGATIHTVRMNGKRVMDRLSISEMSVPYADPRKTFLRKQAFDFGDGGGGACANRLSLGCDCLGAIRYLHTWIVDREGNPRQQRNVVCIHEEDNGIGWKHSNWRTGRAVVTRHRVLVVQFVLTLANYEYIFAYRFDLAGNIEVEIRATGIVSVVPDFTKDGVPFGVRVAPNLLAQDHQHIINIRADMAVAGSENSVLVSETVPLAQDDHRNPYGNAFEVRETLLKTSGFVNSSSSTNRSLKVINNSVINSINKQPAAYDIHIPADQMLLAAQGSLQARRAAFARHNVWVTKYAEGRLFAGGEYTLQSRQESDGVRAMAEQNDILEDEDVVVWINCGFTHRPRLEDWPVMPIETRTISFRPRNFFFNNPAIDAPSSRDIYARLV